MNGLLIGDVFFREYLVQFDVSSPDKTVIGIGKLRHDYQPVKRLEQRRVMNMDASPQALAQTLHVLPAFKKTNERKLTQRAVRSAGLSSRGTPVTALSSETLLDDMPVFNRHGTQYFVNVSIGSPLQHFTVIFDTGSAVFGVFIRNSDLPKSISFSHMRCVSDVAVLPAMLPCCPPPPPSAACLADASSSSVLRALTSANCLPSDRHCLGMLMLLPRSSGSLLSTSSTAPALNRRNWQFPLALRDSRAG
jgi:hypothetical protein